MKEKNEMFVDQIPEGHEDEYYSLEQTKIVKLFFGRLKIRIFLMVGFGILSSVVTMIYSLFKQTINKHCEWVRYMILGIGIASLIIIVVNIVLTFIDWKKVKKELNEKD